MKIENNAFMQNTQGINCISASFVRSRYTNGTNQLQNKSKQKKAVNYNPREFTNALLQCTKSSNVRMILVNVRSRIRNLERCKSSGQYDDSQLNMAIRHAKRVANCAKSKISNLKQEEKMVAEAKAEAKKELQKQREEKQKKMQQRDRDISYIVKKQEQKKQINQKRKKNRMEESNKIESANNDYTSERLKYEIQQGTTHTVTMLPTPSIIDVLSTNPATNTVETSINNETSVDILL